MRKFVYKILVFSILVGIGTAGKNPCDAAERSDAVSVPSVGSGSLRDSIPQARVTGQRALREAGVSRTVFDSLALRENIAVSLADLLGYNSSLFIKQHGRASQSTVSFRGTSSSHTQVLWNGMRINSPMLGMTDFSMIPAYLMDGAELLHGTSSLQETGGGLGGAVILKSGGAVKQGLELQYIQGLGSFWTADEFLKVNYGGRRLRSSTKLLLSTSQNRFKFLNMDKMEVRYDEDMNIVERFHPVETYENGAWRDLHVMQEIGWRTDSGHDFSLSAWYVNSWRELPQLTVDYGDGSGFLNEQRESTLRVVGAWKKEWKTGRSEVSVGYSGTSLDYDYARDRGDGSWYYMTKSRSNTHTIYLRSGVEQHIGERLLLRADISAHSHHVKSADESILLIGTNSELIGYNASRTEISAFASAKWKPVDRVGLSLSVREDLIGRNFSPVIPAFNADVLLWRPWALYLKGSASRNYRWPTLNDLYFMPGGNPDLRPESGRSFETGYSLSKIFGYANSDADRNQPKANSDADRNRPKANPDVGQLQLSLEGNWFDSFIEDWILWVPNGAKKDFYTPLNIAKVHAYGIEQKIKADWRPHKDWHLHFNGSFTWSPSINWGEARSENDESVGKQLVYIPEFSSSFIASASWKTWSIAWKWCWYSRRYTMSSNDLSISGSVPPYFMNDLTLSKAIELRGVGISISAAIKNIFNEHYLSVLARPMPGTNFEIFISVTPHFHVR